MTYQTPNVRRRAIALFQIAILGCTGVYHYFFVYQPQLGLKPFAVAFGIGLVIETISEGRSVRSGLNVPLSAKPALLVIEASDDQRRALAASGPQIAQMLRIGEVREAEAAPVGSIPFRVQGATFALPVAEFIDLAMERSRLTKEVGDLTSEIAKISGKLSNPDFVIRAPEEVVEENREKLAEAETAREKLQGALARLEAVG